MIFFVLKILCIVNPSLSVQCLQVVSHQDLPRPGFNFINITLKESALRLRRF